LEPQVDPWIESLWPALQKAFGRDTDLAKTNQDTAALKIEQVTKNLQSIQLENQENRLSSIPLPWQLVDSLEGELTGVSRPPNALCAMRLTGTKRPARSLIQIAPVLRHTRLTGGKIAIAEDQSVPLFEGRVRQSMCLTTSEALKRTLALDIDLGDVEWEYLPGDAVGILAENDIDLVAALISRLGLDTDDEILFEPIDSGQSGKQCHPLNGM
jgi:sulfite reductase alpha subunit-like flavoprotein